jgi:hypothetical protein
MKELTRTQTSTLIGGDQCRRLRRRSSRAYRQGRRAAGDRLQAKYLSLCANF